MKGKLSKIALRKWLAIALVLGSIFGAFSYGVLVGVYKYFPYEYLSQLHESYKRMTLKKETRFPDQSPETTRGVDWSYDLGENPVEFARDGALNNFVVYRADIEDFANEKLAYMNVSGGLIEAYPQNDFSLISDTGVSEEDFIFGLEILGGIKNIFYYKDQMFALVGLFEETNDCAYAALVNISRNSTVIRFPCLPLSTSTDLNAVGGGFVSLESEQKLLLALGAPENFSEEIRNLAQDDSSPYGKILEIDEKTLFGEGDTYRIFSKGHRNPQSLFWLDGKIIATEHGPRGGDEINLIERGKNYGWPDTSLGTQYDLAYISKDNMSGSSQVFQDPLYSFLPSIGISFVDECPESYRQYFLPNQCVVVGSMVAGTLFFVQFDPSFSKVASIESYEVGSRLRKVAVSGDQMILATDYEGIILLQIGEMDKLGGRRGFEPRTR